MEILYQGVNAILEKNDFYGLGKQYVIRFYYENEHQTKYIYKLMEELTLKYGINSNYVETNYEFIRPYFSDMKGNMVPNNTYIIGGTTIPKNLLNSLIKRFVEIDKINVKFENKIFTKTFDLEAFEAIINDIENTYKK